MVCQILPVSSYSCCHRNCFLHHQHRQEWLHHWLHFGWSDFPLSTGVHFGNHIVLFCSQYFFLTRCVEIHSFVANYFFIINGLFHFCLTLEHLFIRWIFLLLLLFLWTRIAVETDINHCASLQLLSILDNKVLMV